VSNGRTNKPKSVVTGGRRAEARVDQAISRAWAVRGWVEGRGIGFWAEGDRYREVYRQVKRPDTFFDSNRSDHVCCSSPGLQQRLQSAVAGV
jgi:hypothetical protein